MFFIHYSLDWFIELILGIFTPQLNPKNDYVLAMYYPPVFVSIENIIFVTLLVK